MRNIPSAFTVLEFCGASVFTISFNILQSLDFELSRRAPFGYVKQCGSCTMGYWYTVETSIFCWNDRKSNRLNRSCVPLTSASLRAYFDLFFSRACFFIIFVSDEKFDNSIGVRERTD